MAMDTRLGIGVIGCGYWGGNYVRVFNELPDCRTVAVCDVRTDRLMEIKGRHRDIFVTDDVQCLLARKNVDAVVVCTQATRHHNVAMECISKGKHVLIEKPLTTTVADALELTEHAEQRQRVLMVAHTFIYNSGVTKLKEYVSSASSQVYYMHSRRTNLGPIRRDVNAIWDLATHDIAIFNHLLDQAPVWVSAVGARVLGNGHEDVGFVAIGYPGGVVAHVHVSWADPNKAREVVVVCSDKRIVFNDLNGIEQIRVFHKGVKPVFREPSSFGEYQFEIRDGDIVSPKLEMQEPLKAQCSHFIDCIRTRRTPRTSGRHGAEVVGVLNAVDQSIAMGGAQVEVENIGTRYGKALAAGVC